MEGPINYQWVISGDICSGQCLNFAGSGQLRGTDGKYNTTANAGTLKAIGNGVIALFGEPECVNTSQWGTLDMSADVRNAITGKCARSVYTGPGASGDYFSGPHETIIGGFKMAGGCYTSGLPVAPASPSPTASSATPPTSSLTTTCGEVKAAYKAAMCCGNPGNSLELTSTSARRLQAPESDFGFLPNSKSSNQAPESIDKLMDDIKTALTRTQDFGGPFMAKMLASKIQDVANQYLPTQ